MQGLTRTSCASAPTAGNSAPDPLWKGCDILGVIARLVGDCALGQAIQYSRSSTRIRRGRGVLGRVLTKVRTSASDGEAEILRSVRALPFVTPNIQAAHL